MIINHDRQLWVFIKKSEKNTICHYKDNIVAIKSAMYKFFIMLPLLVISKDIANPKYNDFDEQIALMENKITELENLERLTDMRLYEIYKEKDEQQSLLNGLINKKLDTLEIEKQKIIKRFKINENIKPLDKAKHDAFYGSFMYP